MLNSGLESLMARRTDPSFAVHTMNGLRLRMPYFYAVFGIPTFILFMIVYGNTLWQAYTTRKPEMLILCAIGFGLCYVCFMVLMYGVFHRVHVQQNGFVLRGPLKPTRFIAWGEVVEGRYSSFEQAVLITTVDGKKHRISPFLLGCKSLWRSMNQAGGTPIGDWGLPYKYWL